MIGRSHGRSLVLVCAMYCVIVVLTLALAVTPTALAQTSVGGTITQSTTWQGEVLVTDHVTVPAGVALTILPGTRVEFQHYRGYREPQRRLRLEVGGSIVAVGTAVQPIYFTSDAADPQNGDCALLHIGSPTGPTQFEYCVFEFGLQGLNAWQASPQISHCVFRWHNWEGVYFESYCQPTLTYCEIYENGYNGLAAEQSNTIVMDCCHIWRNGTSGVHIDNSVGEIRRSLIHDNGGEIDGAYGTVASSFYPPSLIDIGFSADQSNALGYIPGDQQLDGYMYVYPDDETRRILHKMGAGLGLTWALAWDGQYIWASTAWAHIYKLNPQSGQVLEDFVLSGSPGWGTPLQPWGMTFDDEGYLWLLDFAARKIFKINPSTHAIVYSIDSPYPAQGGCKGLAWDGSYLCVMGWVSPVIYQMTKTGSLVNTITLDTGGAGGLTWDGEYFWCPGAEGIAKYDRHGHQVGWIYAASEGTWDLAWDGRYLWASQRTNENWPDAKIYQLEILDDHSEKQPSFADVDADHPYRAGIIDLASRGIILGKADGLYHPGDPVTRQQFAKMIAKTMAHEVPSDIVCPFADVDPTPNPIDPLYPAKYVAVCALHGITQGKTATTFEPSTNIQRFQVLSMVVRAVDEVDQELLATPPVDFVPTWNPALSPQHGANASRAEYNGLLAGIDTAVLEPFADMTRGEIAQVLHNLLQELSPATAAAGSTGP